MDNTEIILRYWMRTGRTTGKALCVSGQFRRLVKVVLPALSSVPVSAMTHAIAPPAALFWRTTSNQRCRLSLFDSRGT